MHNQFISRANRKSKQSQELFDKNHFFKVQKCFSINILIDVFAGIKSRRKEKTRKREEGREAGGASLDWRMCESYLFLTERVGTITRGDSKQSRE